MQSDGDLKHNELRSRLPHSLQTLEEKLRDEMKETAKTVADLHERHQASINRAVDGEQKLWQEIAQLSRDQDAKTKEHVGRIQGALDSLAVKLRDDAEFAAKAQDARHNQTHSHLTTITESLDSKLRDEILRVSKEHEDELLRGLQRQQSLLEHTDAKLHQDLDRVAEEQDAKRERVFTSLTSSFRTNLDSQTASLQEELARVADTNDRLHDEQNHRAKIVVDGLETKLHELITRLSCEENVKHEEHRNNLRVSLADVLNKLRSEMKQASDEAAARYQELRSISTSELSSQRDQLTQLAMDQDAKHERAHHFTTTSVQQLSEKVDSGMATRAEEEAAERIQRGREIGDLCSAVKSMQVWLTDVETLAGQRNDARTQDVEALNSRWSELKEVVTHLRHEVVSHQEHIDSWKGLDVNRATEELRLVVQDISIMSQNQGDKICSLEGQLQDGRQAKLEVHRVASDLAVEIQARTSKDAELQARLEREVQEFGRRVERLTGATCELGDSLRNSETRRHSMAVFPSLAATPRTRAGSMSTGNSLLTVDF